MNSRERFSKTMEFQRVDSIPWFEEGLRPDVLEYWRDLGKPVEKLEQFQPTDAFYEIQPELDPIPEFYPSDDSELKQFSDYLNPSKYERVSEKELKKTKDLSHKNHLGFLRVHRGFFISLGVGDWRRFDKIMYWVLEKPDFIKQCLKIQGEFNARITEKKLDNISIDAAIFSEPIGGNEGPLISPAMYEEFVLESYKPLLTVLKNHSVKTIILRTYANARSLIPVILKYGFNCLWACEVNTKAMDYQDLRREFGKQLRLIGGIDLDMLRLGKKAIQSEMEQKVKPLLKQGGYIPLVDGRVRKEMPFESYLYYRQLMAELIKEK